MPHGSLQFTPGQLLEAGRHAEADGKLDLASQFYRHLTDQFGDTVEAAEGRSRLNGIWAAASQAWHGNGGPPPASGAKRGLAVPRSQRRTRGTGKTGQYRFGRALAAVVSGIGWLALGAALVGLAAAIAADLLQVALIPGVGLGQGLYMAGAALGGVLAMLWSQAARAQFDQASAARELLAIERARANGEQP